jgi:PAS domain S-box-containing protein
MEDVIGKTDFDIYPPALAEEFWKINQAVLQSGQSVIYHEEPGLDTDGNFVSVLTSKIPLRDGEGNVIGMVGVGRDITERKRIEQALQESQDKLEFAQRIAHVGHFEYKVDTNVLTVSDEIYRILGLESRTDLILSKGMEQIHSEDRAKVSQALADCIKTGQPFKVEYRIVRPDGQERFLYSEGGLIRDDSNRPSHVFGIAQDITERKQAEDRLRESENRLVLALSGAQMSVWEWNLQSNQIFWSPEFFEITGMKEDEFGRTFESFTDLIHAEDVRRVMNSAEKAMREQTLFVEEFRIIRPDGEIRWLSNLGHAEYDLTGTYLRLIGTVQDITQRKQAEIERQALLEIMQGLSNTKDLQELLELVQHSIAKLVYAENFFVVLYQESTGLFEEIYSVDQYDLPESPSKLENSITAYVFHSGQPLLLNRATFEELAAQGEVKLIGTDSASWLGVPLKTSGKTIGVMAVQDYEQDNRYSEHDKDFLASIATQVAVAIERKRAEEALRESEERFSSAFEYASIGMALLTPEGRSFRVNRALCNLTGYSEAELLKKTFQDITHPEDLQVDLSYVSQLLRGEIHSYQMEKRYLHKLGHAIWILLSVSLLRDNQENPLYFIAQIQDITERKRAEEEIRRRAEETAALLETSLALANLELEATLQTIGNSASSLFLADGCRIFLLEPDAETLRCVLALGENTDAFLNLRIKIGQGVTGAVAAAGKPEIVNEMQNDPRAMQVSGTDEEQEAIMFAPLKERERTIGILSIRRVGVKQPFQPVDLELLEAFASMAASAVSKARLFEETQRRLAELRASEERFQQLAENIQEAFWMTDMETNRELYMSPAAETIWGRSIQSLMYEPNAWVNSIFSEDRPALLDAVEREKNGEKVQIEYRIVRPDGTLRWIWDRAFPIVDDSGQVRRIAGISADITERRESELALIKSQNRYRELFDSSPISIWEEDFSLVKKQLDSLLKNGVIDLREYLSSHPEYVSELASLVKITDVNKASLELYGLHRKEDLLHSLADLFDNASLEHFEQEILGLMGPLKRFNWEGAEVTPAGRQIEILVNGSIPHGYEEDWSKVIVSIIDVTERRQAEQELRKLSRAVEQSGSTIVITDTSGNIEYVNPKFTQITGYSYEEMIGKNPRILKSGLTPDEEYKQLWETISSGREWHGELLNKKKDGTLYWESVTISPVLNDRKEITHYVGVKEDITERKQSEIEIRRHIAELEAVYENGLSVGRLLEPGEIGNRVIETFARYLPWHHVTIRLRKEGSEDLELVSFNLPNLREEERADTEQHFVARVNKVGQGLSGWVIQTGMPLRTGDVHAHPQYIDTHAAIQSGLYMPLKVGGRVIGVISVESEAPNAFTEQDERLLATLANQTAVAFENARLYEAMQKELLERKRVEEALRISETHYRALADSITDILFELDQDLRYTHWNKASEALTGIPASEAIGKSIEEILGRNEEQTRIKMIYQDVLGRGAPRTFETTLVFHGEKRSFETTAYPSSRGVSVVAKDVTDRKRTETIMQKRFELMEYSAKHSLNELMLRAVDEVSELTSSTIGFFNFMEEDQVNLGLQTWSTNALRLFHVSSQNGSHLPLDQAGVWAEAVRQRRPLIHNDYEALADRKGLPQGHVPIVREIVIPIIRNERIMAVMGIANKPHDYTSHDLEIAMRLADYAWDITERKQMEIALQLEKNQLVQRVEERTADLSRANSNLARALRVKDEFLANMSHELRTPLNAILGLSESLGEQIAGPLNEKQQKYISTISESGHHLLSLINDILDLAKIDAGQITLDINKVDIHSVCQASLRMIKQLAQKKNQDVSLEIDPGLGLMWADERRLKQMIVNLLGNAVKFTPEYGKLGLEVHGDEEANQIAITVWDHGIGIKQEDMARLFQPFVQLDSGLAREATGTGLGLALVAQMARLHGGSVNVVSEVGKGSRFTIVLPWEPALAMDTASRMKITGKFRAIQTNETNKPTILLVEDTKEVVMMLKDYLELTGFRVFTAQDGIDGLVQARHVKPDLILMDVQMPGMDGFETTRKLRSDPTFRYTPIIALTALAMPNDRERCLEAGMDEYISKPVNLKALVKIIQSCLFEQGSRTR